MRNRVKADITRNRYFAKIADIVLNKIDHIRMFSQKHWSEWRTLKIHCGVGHPQSRGNPDEKSGTKRECLSRKTQLCACASCSCYLNIAKTIYINDWNLLLKLLFWFCLLLRRIWEQRGYILSNSAQNQAFCLVNSIYKVTSFRKMPIFRQKMYFFRVFWRKWRKNVKLCRTSQTKLNSR